MFSYVYVLFSKKDRKFYVGKTKNLKIRFEDHCNGRVPSTCNRRPLSLVYYEACRNSKDSDKREKYLKTSYGKHYLRSRLKSYFTG